MSRFQNDAIKMFICFIVAAFMVKNLVLQGQKQLQELEEEEKAEAAEAEAAEAAETSETEAEAALEKGIVTRSADEAAEAEAVTHDSYSGRVTRSADVEGAKSEAGDDLADPVLSSIPSCEGVEGPKTLGAELRWTVLKRVLTALKEVSAAYFLTAGSLLYLVRECDTGATDMDVDVDSIWWQTPGNAEKLEAALTTTGLKRTLKFGQLDKFGYEERWMFDGPKQFDGLQVDIFASDSIVEGERREAIWYHGKHVYECVMKVQSYVWYSWWGQQVRLPYPFEPALLSSYGPNYIKKQGQSHWSYKCRCNNSAIADWPRDPNFTPIGC